MGGAYPKSLALHQHISRARIVRIGNKAHRKLAAEMDQRELLSVTDRRPLEAPVTTAGKDRRPVASGKNRLSRRIGAGEL